MTSLKSLSRNQFWLDKWESAAEQPNHFATMGRNSYTISDYFIYMADIVSGLGGLSKTDTLLDAAGGCGYLSMYLSPFVANIDLFDYSQPAISRAKSECKNFANITPYQDNLLDFANTKAKHNLYDKIVVGGALQYFDSYDEVAQILKHVFEVCAPNARTLVTHTTDAEQKDKHIASYQQLTWAKEDIEKAVFEELNHRLWLEFDKIKNIAHQIGFAQCSRVPINEQLFQANHMFDFYLVK